MEMLRNAIHGLIDGAGPLLILLGLLIFVHELGHFLVAKFFKVRVETFSLGFGKKILQFKWGETTYCISIMPLGGYVKMYGDDPTKEIPESERAYSFVHKPVSQRIAVVLAGPLMNLFFAFFLFIFVGLVGEPVPAPLLGDVDAKTRAFESGFRSGDRILSVDSKTVETWPEVKELVSNSANVKLQFEVERSNSQERAQIAVTPVIGENDNILSHQAQVGAIEGLDIYSQAAMVGVMSSQSVAAKSGLHSFDVVIQINDREVNSWRDLDQFLREDLFKGRTPVKIKVQSSLENERKPQTREVSLDFNSTVDAKTMGSGHGDGQLPRVIELSEIGIEPAQLYLWKVKKGSPADQAGLQVGDRILSVNGNGIGNWMDVIELVKNYNPDKGPIEFTIRREDQEKKASITPEMTAFMSPRGREEQRFTVGIVSGMLQSSPKMVISKSKGLVDNLGRAVERTWETTTMVIMSLVRLIQGDVSAKNVGGIISIGRFANQSYDAGFSSFLKMMALISINLFLLNLLPVPVLDGGHLVFYSIEALRGAPLSMRKMEIAQQVGLVLLMSLMAFAFFNDISNWINSVW